MERKNLLKYKNIYIGYMPGLGFFATINHNSSDYIHKDGTVKQICTDSWYNSIVEVKDAIKKFKKYND